jgi:hypothetical protein
LNRIYHAEAHPDKSIALRPVAFFPPGGLFSEKQRAYARLRCFAGKPDEECGPD